MAELLGHQVTVGDVLLWSVVYAIAKLGSALVIEWLKNSS